MVPRRPRLTSTDLPPPQPLPYPPSGLDAITRNRIGMLNDSPVVVQ